MSGQTPYQLKEGALGSLATTIGSKLQKAAKNKGKQEAAKIKEEAVAKAQQEIADAAAAGKRKATRQKNATKKAEANAPKPGRMSGSKDINTRPTGLPAIKPVVLNRNQHFESAVGNAKDASASRATTPKVDYSAAEAYND